MCILRETTKSDAVGEKDKCQMTGRRSEHVPAYECFLAGFACAD